MRSVHSSKLEYKFDCIQDCSLHLKMKSLLLRLAVFGLLLTLVQARKGKAPKKCLQAKDKAYFGITKRMGFVSHLIAQSITRDVH